MRKRELTKEQRGLMWAYDRAECSTIEQAYKNPSAAKIRAFNDIWFEMKQRRGQDMRITGKSCHFFSCAYRYYDDAGNLRLCYHAPTRVIDFELIGQ